MKDVDRVKLQVEMLERLYLAERAKRETVRSSLAIPIAALTFASFGFGIFAPRLGWVEGSLGVALLSVSCILLGLAALALFLRAIRQLLDVRYSADLIEPDLLQFSMVAKSTEAELTESGIVDSDLAETSTLGALEFLSEELSIAYKALEEENRFNLDLQGEVFKTLLPGLGMLIAAIFLAAILKTIVDSSEGDTAAAGAYATLTIASEQSALILPQMQAMRI